MGKQSTINLYDSNNGDGYFDLYLSSASSGQIGNASTVMYNVTLKVKISKLPEYTSSITATHLGFMICKKSNNAPGEAIGIGYKVPTKAGSSSFGSGTLSEDTIYTVSFTNLAFGEAVGSEDYYVYLLFGTDGNINPTTNCIITNGTDILSGTIHITSDVLLKHSYTGEVTPGTEIIES